MPKLLIGGLVGAAVFTLANLYTTGACQPADDAPVEAQAKTALVQAILDEENEERRDSEDLQDGEEPEDGDDVQGDLENENDQEDPSDEGTTPT
jgi:hypothetical protein